MKHQGAGGRIWRCVSLRGVEDDEAIHLLPLKLQRGKALSRRNASEGGWIAPLPPVARNTPPRAGFTFLEMAMVVAIIGIVVAGGAMFSNDIINKREAIDSKERLGEIVTAIEHFYTLNGHLPCPASWVDVNGDANFARQVALDDACEAYTTAPAGTLRVETSGGGGGGGGGGSGVWVLMGAVPVRDLLLNDDLIGDGYNNRYSYAVMQSLTSTATFALGAGGMVIKDSAANNIITDGAYVVFSHGEDGTGAYLTTSGVLRSACGSTNLDTENCDWDIGFVDSPYNNGTVPANYFDDFIRWQSKRYYQ